LDLILFRNVKHSSALIIDRVGIGLLLHRRAYSRVQCTALNIKT